MADATKAFQETDFEVKYIKINKIYVTQVYKIGKSEIT